MISRLLVPYNTIKYYWLGNYPKRLSERASVCPEISRGNLMQPVPHHE